MVDVLGAVGELRRKLICGWRWRWRRREDWMKNDLNLEMGKALYMNHHTGGVNIHKAQASELSPR